MSADLALVDNDAELSETGLYLPLGLSHEDWLNAGQKLGRAHRASAWWIGDWINYGEDAGYVARDKYDEAVEITGLARKTLRNYAYTARSYKSSRRRDDLTYGHHESVVRIPAAQRAELLEAAEAGGWSVLEIRRQAAPLREQRTVPTGELAKQITEVMQHVDEIVRLAPAIEENAWHWLAPKEVRKHIKALDRAQKLVARMSEQAKPASQEIK